MPEPLTIEEFRRFSSTFEEILKRNLNDRFDHYEKRAISRESGDHSEIMESFGEVISTVNDHIDERFKNVGEQFKNVDTHFKSIDEQFKNVGEQFKGVSEQFKNVSVQFKSIEQKMDKGFTAIERRLDSLAVQQELRKEFDALVSFVASKYNLSATEIIGQSTR